MVPTFTLVTWAGSSSPSWGIAATVRDQCWGLADILGGRCRHRSCRHVRGEMTSPKHVVLFPKHHHLHEGQRAAAAFHHPHSLRDRDTAGRGWLLATIPAARRPNGRSIPAISRLCREALLMLSPHGCDIEPLTSSDGAPKRVPSALVQATSHAQPVAKRTMRTGSKTTE